jgi:hypothetical protein
MKKYLLLPAILLWMSADAQELKTSAVDSTQIRTTIMKFYNWYNKNYQRLQNFKLYYSIKKNDGPPYRINWTEAERYLSYLRSSVPGLGEAFIKNQRAFFKQCDSAFKVDVEDELPFGFDFDWYTNSQEDPQYLLDELNKAKRWSIVLPDKSTANVLVFGHSDSFDDDEVKLCARMKKEKGVWKIAKIECDLEINPPPPKLQ